MTRLAVLDSAGSIGLTAGDADHDTWPEIYSIATPEDDTLVIFRRLENGAYERIKTGVEAGCVWAFGDGDADGQAEIVCQTVGFYVREAPDAYSFPLDSIWGASTCTGFLHYPEYADLDLDNRQEIVVGVHNSGVRLYENVSDNVYDSVATLTCPGAAAFSPSAIGDFDLDARPDLVFGTDQYNLYVYEWTGLDNQYELSAICTTGTHENYALAAAPYIDKDSWPRFVALGRCRSDDADKLMVYRATGHAHYERVWEQTVEVPLLAGPSIAVGDVDGDEVEEIAVLFGGKVMLYKNTGSDSYEVAWQMDSAYAWCPVLLTDVNRDGRVELVLSLQDHISIYEDTTGLTQVSERTRAMQPLRIDVCPSVLRLFATARFSGLPERSELVLYSSTGQLVRRQVIGRSSAWTWNLTDQHGRRVPTGTYFAIIRSPSQTARLKLCVVN